MTAPAPKSVPGVIIGLYVVDVGIGLLAVANFAIARVLEVERAEFLRLGMESNLPSWYSTVQLFAVAVVLGLLAWRDTDLRKPSTWHAAIPSGLLLLLSLDEGGMVHERIGQSIQRVIGPEANLVTEPWIYLMAPLYGLLAWAAFLAARRYLRDRPEILRLLSAGAGLFIVSAAGIEFLGTLTPEGSLARGVLGVFEEVGEMMAVTTMLWAALRLVAAEGIRVQFRAPGRA